MKIFPEMNLDHGSKGPCPDQDVYKIDCDRCISADLFVSTKRSQHFRRWLSGTASIFLGTMLKYVLDLQLIMSMMMDDLGLGLGQSGLFGLWSVFALGKHPMSSWALPAACVYDPLFSSQQYVISFLQWVHLELQLLFFGGFGGYFWGSRGLGGST